MMYHLSHHRCGDDTFPRFANFPIRDANFLEAENQFGYAVLYVLMQISNCSLEKRSRDVPTLIFLGGTFYLDDFLFCALSNPAQDLLLTISVEGDMLSSFSGLAQPVREGRLDMTS
jgi:hypothetical protein